MLEPYVLLKDKFKFDDIVVNRVVSSRVDDPEVSSRAKTIWAEVIAEAEKTGRKAWDSEIYRFEGIEKQKTGYKLEVSTVPYSFMHAVKQIPEFWQLPKDYWPMHISTGAIIKTSDNFYVFGQRNSNTLSSSNVDLIGGSLNASEIEVVAGNDILTSLFTELKEEANISTSQVNSNELIGIIVSPSSNVIFIATMDLHISKSELEKQFNEENDGEMVGLRYIPEKDLVFFLEYTQGYRPLIAQLLQTP